MKLSTSPHHSSNPLRVPVQNHEFYAGEPHMKIRQQIKIFILVIAASQLEAFAAEYAQKSGHYSAHEILRPSDRVDNITRLALEKIKISASAEAGGYVLGSEHLLNGEYNESIQVISGGIVALSNIHTQIETLSDVTMEVIVDADTSVDLESLKQRVSSIQENKALRKILDQKNQQYLAALKNKDYGKVYTIEKEYLSSLPTTKIADLNYLAKLSEQLTDSARNAIIDVDDTLPDRIQLKTFNNEIYTNNEHAYLSANYSASIDYIGLSNFLSDIGRVIPADSSTACLVFNEGMKNIDIKALLQDINRFNRYSQIFTHLDFELTYSDGSTKIHRGTFPWPSILEAPKERTCEKFSTNENFAYALFSYRGPSPTIKVYVPVPREYLNGLASIKSWAIIGEEHDEPKKGTTSGNFPMEIRNRFPFTRVQLLLDVKANKWTGDN